MTFQAEQRAGGRARDAVLARAGLGDDACLAHAPGQQCLSQRVVDLVCTGVREVLSLEKHPDAVVARARGKSGSLVHRRWTADVVLQQPIELVAERRIGARSQIPRGELLNRSHERLGHEAAAVDAEVAARIGIAAPEDRG